MRLTSTTPPPSTSPDSASATPVAAGDNSARVDRTDAMLRMMALGMPLDEIEQQLDWLDARARLQQR
jgi:hypothetical protein